MIKQNICDISLRTTEKFCNTSNIGGASVFYKEETAHVVMGKYVVGGTCALSPYCVIIPSLFWHVGK